MDPPEVEVLLLIEDPPEIELELLESQEEEPPVLIDE